MLEALILDFDGLIVDTEEAEYQALAELFSVSGKRLEYETWRRHVGPVSPDWITELANPGSASYAQLRQRFEGLHSSLVQVLPTLPGVEELLEFAGRFSVPVAVVTSATRDRLLPQLTSRGIDGRLNSIVSLEDVTVPKPAPEPYLWLSNGWPSPHRGPWPSRTPDRECAPQQTLVFGVSPSPML